MSIDEFAFTGLAEQAAQIQRRALSPVELTRRYLERIDRLDPVLRSYITVCGERALDQARVAEREIMAGRHRGRLHGIPYGVKDQIFVAGVRTTGASSVLADFVPDYDATAIARLNTAGAILLGKQNLDEWGKGGTVHHKYGQPRNAWNVDHTPSGSSSGSGVATAAGLCSFSLGEDTGGSVRQPAAANGVVGLRPTFGRVSRHGALLFGWNADTIGPLARTVTDAALVLEVIAGEDQRDPLTSSRPVPDYAAALGQDLVGLRLAVVRELSDDPALHPAMRRSFREAVATLRSLGAEVAEVSLPLARHATTAVMLTTDADIAAVFLHRWLRRRWREFDVGTRRRLAVACLIPASVYSRAMRARVLIRREVLEALKRFDCLLSPTNPSPPARVDAGAGRIDASTGMGKLRRMCTYPFTVANTPAVSVPAGFSDDGLPVALQIAGRPFDEATVLRVAYAYEQASPWHARHPELSGFPESSVEVESQVATTPETVAASRRRDLRVSTAQLRAMAAMIDLPLPREDEDEVRVRLSALLSEMEGIERELGSRISAVDPIPAVYPREEF